MPKRKTLPLFLAALLAIALRAATAGAVPLEPLPDIKSLDLPAMTQDVMMPDKTDLPRIMKTRTIRVLTTYSLTNYFWADGQAHGFEYGMMKEFGKLLDQGRKKGEPPFTVVYMPVPFHRLIPALLEGHGDVVAAGVTITPEREKLVAFSAPYLTGIDEIAVSYKAKGVKLAVPEDLSGKKVFVRKSSSYFLSLRALNKKLKAQGKKPVEIVEADEFLNTEDILEMVSSGIVELTICDSNVAELWAQVLPGITLHPGAAVRTGGKLAYMVRKDNPQLLAKLNAFVKGHKRGTRLGNIYYNRYFATTKWVRNPMNDDDWARFQKYMALFKKYGKKYDIDWLLIAAQAYQESGFDPNAKSHAGAIGLMQVLPSLAQDPRVGIGDLHTDENNVHAGVKYLDLIRRTYFGDSGMTDEEKLRYSLASYNAGPTRMSRIRGRVPKMGLDPDIWFENGEVATMHYVSKEPVRYVRNINKYYVAFKLSQQQLGKRQEVMEQMKKEAGKKK